MKTKVTALLVLVSAMASSSAYAGFATYSDRTTWQGAAGTVTGSEDFNSYVTDTLISVDPSTTVFSDGLSLSQSTTSQTIDWEIDTNPFSNNFECDVDGTSRLCGNNWSDLTFHFATGISAFAADFSSINDNADRTVFDLFDGNTLLASLATPQVSGQVDQFFGFVATAGESITSIRTRDFIPDTFGVDNIEFVSAGASVPEPTSLALLGFSLFGLGITTRRKSISK